MGPPCRTPGQTLPTGPPGNATPAESPRNAPNRGTPVPVGPACGPCHSVPRPAPLGRPCGLCRSGPFAGYAARAGLRAWVGPPASPHPARTCGRRNYPAGALGTQARSRGRPAFCEPGAAASGNPWFALLRSRYREASRRSAGRSR
jgi:hypothetical protein